MEKQSRNTVGLIPFKKGQSGNPKGRPPGESFATILQRILAKNIKTKDPFDSGRVVKMTVKERIALAMAAKAMKGGEKAADLVLDRLEGKVAQPMKISGLPPPISQTTVNLGNAKTEDLEDFIKTYVKKNKKDASPS